MGHLPHGRQSTPSSALEVKMPDGLLTIGELACRASVATSALRYYEELGLLSAPTGISWQRRYPESAAQLVIILLLRDAGFTRRPRPCSQWLSACWVSTWSHRVTEAVAEGGDTAAAKVREASDAIARLVRS